MSDPAPAPTPPSAAPRDAAWRDRLLVLLLVGGFLAALWWSGSGRTRNLSALQRQLSVQLQVTLVGLEYRNVAEGVLLATGQGVFRFLDVAPAWERYQADASVDLAVLAEELATPLRADIAAVAAWEATGHPAAQLVALPVPMMHYGTEMDRTLAAEHLAVAKLGDLPAYLFLREPASAVLRPLTREVAERAAPKGAVDRLVAQVVVRQMELHDAERAEHHPADARESLAATDWGAAETPLPPLPDGSGGWLPPLARLFAQGPGGGLIPWESFATLSASSPWHVTASVKTAADLGAPAAPARDGAPRWPKTVVFTREGAGWRPAGFR